MPLAPPIGLVGVVFGALAIQVGFSAWQAVLCSLIVISGAAQLSMVSLLPLGPGAVLIATTGLGLRHVPMSATLSHLIGPVPLWRRLLLSLILVDETFGLTLNAAQRGEPNLASYKSGCDLVLYSTWITTTVIGTILGTSMDPAEYGIDVIFPLVFLAIALPMLKDRRQIITALVAIVAALGAVQFLPPAWQVSVAALVAAALGSRIR